MRIAFQVAYIGTDFAGSQLQNGERTVEGEFIAACERLELFDTWREAGFCAAGRTDRGVHAFGQVCTFSTEQSERAVAALNQQLPRDCWCRGYTYVDEGFHPRYRARTRTYRYYLAETGLDCEAMGNAAHLFEGAHDFSSFARPEGRDPHRILHAVRVWGDRNFIVIEVCGESFLWHMVRGMVTTLLAVGRGTVSDTEVNRLLEGSSGQRVPPAPAEGLVLWDVDCGICFTPLPMAARHHQRLTALHHHYLVLGEITGLSLSSKGDASHSD